VLRQARRARDGVALNVDEAAIAMTAGSTPAPPARAGVMVLIVPSQARNREVVASEPAPDTDHDERQTERDAQPRCPRPGPVQIAAQ
jgi:hypothetical protein